MSFPDDFVWGAAASSYQVEGAAFEDGKGLSVWDMYCRKPGAVVTGEKGDVACDHYHRYQEDARLMGDIGLKAYRLSINWARVMPDGVGAINEKGLAFYDRLVDSLLENQVTPWVTLFHWDYPYELYCRGGWLNRDSADWFAEYTQVMVDRLSDRVQHWMTQNEPQCFIGHGHQNAYHAPGLALDFSDVLLAAHNSLLAHGKSVQVIRDRSKLPSIIGAAPVGIVRIPKTESPADIAAARKSTFAISRKDVWNNTWFSDPMMLGHYPADGLALFEDEMPKVHEGDMETICQPLDFFGANIYSGDTFEADADGHPVKLPPPEGGPQSMMGWDITPKILYWAPRFFHERYGLPVVVTENGMANTDWMHTDGAVHDPQRIDFLKRYLREFHRSIEDGVVAQGYFMWSIMDNFEWAYGFSKRFGMIYVDYANQQRTLKDSAHWYREVIASNGASLLEES